MIKAHHCTVDWRLHDGTSTFWGKKKEQKNNSVYKSAILHVYQGRQYYLGRLHAISYRKLG